MRQARGNGVSSVGIRKRASGERERRISVPFVASRQRLRTAATRKALLDAAFKIFVRDGFEASRIEDIAAEAGRSRGAFYVNYSNKAEVFLALRAEQFPGYQERFRKQLQGQATREEQVQAVQEHMTELALEKSYILLELEFKLFAIRHPKMLQRLAQKHIEGACEIDELRDLFPKGERGTLIMQQRMLALEAILEGFALNVAFHSEAMTPKYVERCVAGMTRLVLGSPS
jgi:AcrR family transcriptional regulator